MTWTTRQRSEREGVAFLEAGSGARILLVHGVGLRAEAWNRQTDALSGRFQVIAADMPGHGESACVGDDAGLAGFSEKLAILLDRPAVVVGHSMGAMVALDLAIRFPQKVRGVVALNAIFRRTETARRAVEARAQTLDGKTSGDPEGPLSRWFGDRPSPERTACETWLKSVDPRGYRAAYRIFATEDGPADAGLEALACPALFMTGGREPNSTPDMSRAMAALAPEGEARVIEEAAHMMPMTHSKDVTDAIETFAEGCFR